MSTLHLRPAPRAPIARRSVEELVGRIAELVLERQSMRSCGETATTLERNRAELVAAHWELSRALIERHCPPKADSEFAAA